MDWIFYWKSKIINNYMSPEMLKMLIELKIN